MRKLILIISLLIVFSANVYAAKIPQDVQTYLENELINVDIRFDGVITFPSNTVYLPLFPSLFSDIKKLDIKQTYPANRTLRQEPDVIRFNNDFVLMKVFSDGEGHRTVAHLSDPPLQVRTGLLPQDMLVPSGLIIPENVKSIIGNLDIELAPEKDIKVTSDVTLSAKVYDEESKEQRNYNFGYEIYDDSQSRKLDEGIFLSGIVSRKKQIIPSLFII